MLLFFFSCNSISLFSFCLCLVQAFSFLLPLQVTISNTANQVQDSSKLKLTRKPLVIWHGLGDTYDSEGIASIGALLNETVGPTYLHAIRLSNDSSSDRSATFFGNLTEQLEAVCNDLSTHPILSQHAAINAIGFSQGGQFFRGYIERCNLPRVSNLVTFGSQHNGISAFQNCAESNLNPYICAAWDGLLKSRTWSDLVQNRLIPAQYFRDPADLDSYLAHSNFLADVNNERPQARKALYKRNLASLDKFWMYIFTNDTTVVPKESGWFDDVVGTGKEINITKLVDRDLYKEDWLGLRELNERGALAFKSAKGRHMQISDDLLLEVFGMMYN